MHFAAREGFLETVNMLLEDQADPSMLNIKGENVLHISVKESHYNIAKRLIDYTVENKNQKYATDLVNQPNKVSIIIGYFLLKHSLIILK